MSQSYFYLLAACGLGAVVLILVARRMSRGKQLGFKIGYYLYTRTSLGYMYNQHKLNKAVAEFGARGHSIVEPVRFGELEIEAVAYGTDNYAYVITDKADGTTVLVDPGDAVTVLEVLAQRKLKASVVLTTHKHWDHSAGNSQIRRRDHSISIYGGINENVPGATISVSDGESIECGRLKFKAQHSPGHTAGHVVYILDGSEFNAPLCLFSGDVLFVAGIGKLFEGSAADMVKSLDAILALPENTLLFPGHEYALGNLEFASSLEPTHTVVYSKLKEVQALRDRHQCTSPTTLGDELTYNPFLRTTNPRLVSCLPQASRDWIEKQQIQELMQQNQELRQQQLKHLKAGSKHAADLVSGALKYVGDNRVFVLAEIRKLKDEFKPSTPATN